MIRNYSRYQLKSFRFTSRLIALMVALAFASPASFAQQSSKPTSKPTAKPSSEKQDSGKEAKAKQEPKSTVDLVFVGANHTIRYEDGPQKGKLVHYEFDEFLVQKATENKLISLHEGFFEYENEIVRFRYLPKKQFVSYGTHENTLGLEEPITWSMAAGMVLLNTVFLKRTLGVDEAILNQNQNSDYQKNTRVKFFTRMRASKDLQKAYFSISKDFPQIDAVVRPILEDRTTPYAEILNQNAEKILKLIEEISKEPEAEEAKKEEASTEKKKEAKPTEPKRSIMAQFLEAYMMALGKIGVEKKIYSQGEVDLLGRFFNKETRIDLFQELSEIFMLTERNNEMNRIIDSAIKMAIAKKIPLVVIPVGQAHLMGTDDISVKYLGEKTTVRFHFEETQKARDFINELTK